MFKKIILVLITVIGAQATDTFIEYTQTIESTQKNYVYQIQPLEELVGNGGTKHEITLGKRASENFSYGVGLGYVPDTSEFETSLKLRIQTNTTSGLNAFLGTRVGMGMQTGQKEKQLSTNITKLDYSTQSNLEAFKTPSTGVLTEDPLFLDMGASIGVSYKVFKNVEAFLSYEYQVKYWQVDYRVRGKESVENRIVEAQRLNNIAFGLTYLF